MRALLAVLIVCGSRAATPVGDRVLRAIASWRFEPANHGGKPVRARQTESTVLRLSDG